MAYPHTHTRESPIMQTTSTQRHKVALVFTDTLTGSGTSAIYRGLMAADELQRHGDDVVLVFDGAGAKTAAELADPAHRFHALFAAVRPSLRGVCEFCANSYGVLDAVKAYGLPLLDDDQGHASLRTLLNEGRQIITI
jgi:hypothetical protein